jgi:predicted peroxiredoxin
MGQLPDALNRNAHVIRIQSAGTTARVTRMTAGQATMAAQPRAGGDVNGKAVISLTTGLEDPEKVTVAFLVAVGAAEQGRPTLMFLTKEAVRLTVEGVAQGVACEGCPSLADLTKRYAEAGGRYLVCPICFNSRHLAEDSLVDNATLGGTVPLWEWIGDAPATTFSY